MNKTMMALACVCALFALAGCRGTAPVYNVATKTVSACNAQALEKAILAGGTERGWSMEKIQPGLIQGTLWRRGHQAVVSIPYTADTYSIRYKSSSELKYNAKKDKIHPQYNNWINYLDHSIMKALGEQACAE